MQVYISWAGQTSYKYALRMRDLLRKVTPGLEIWISAEDILDGVRWSPDFIQILNEVTFCIVCVDPSNHLSPWMQFELGAIAKSINKFNIRILLHEVKLSELSEPFTLFPPFSVNKNEFQSLFDDLLAIFPRIRIPRFEMLDRLNKNWETFEDEMAEIDLETRLFVGNQEQELTNVEITPREIGYINDVGQNILALISVNDGIDEERIATTMYISRNDTLRYLIDLENKELVQSNLSFGIRRWYITEAGRKFLPGVYQT